MTKQRMHQTWQNIRIPLGLVLFLFGGVVWAVNLSRDVTENKVKIGEHCKTIEKIDSQLQGITERLGEIKGSLKLILKRRR